jgi:hypothetical protein
MLTQPLRSERVRLPVPILYRAAGAESWSQGRIVNISESGVLFGPTALEQGAPVELIFSTPITVGSMASGKFMCVGQIVRTTETGVAGAQFEECRFLLEPDLDWDHQ